MSQKGILGRKLGMTQVFDDANRVDAGHRHRGRAVSRGAAQDARARRLRRGAARLRRHQGVAADQARARSPEGRRRPPQQYLAELRVDDLSGFELGQMIKADVFAAGERVDVTGISKGNGFTGVMKRHNFSGQGASHGNHKKHRAPGSIGACATPGARVQGHEDGRASSATPGSPRSTSTSSKATPSATCC